MSNADATSRAELNFQDFQFMIEINGKRTGEVDYDDMIGVIMAADKID